MGDALTVDVGWYSNDAATFGDRMAAAREALGMSTEDLARRIGVRVKTVRDWENDISEPRANKLQMLAGVLNVSLTWLLAGEGEGLAAPAEGGGLADNDAQRVLAEIRALRSEIVNSADRLAVLEKQLRKALAAETA